MKNIHILPTDKPSRLWLTKLGNLTRCHDIKPIKEALGNNVNIYITSDSDLDINDWVTDGKDIWQVSYILADNIQQAKKIILTTDQDLIKDGVQKIDDEFLEWFVKNPSCEEVKVKKSILKIPNRYDDDFRAIPYLKIIIPKEESKQIELIKGISKGTFNMIIGKSKQETLEEAAERFAEKYKGEEQDPWYDFMEGAKWQQEQIGKSEFLQRLRGTLSDAEARRLLFETFKKK